MVESWRRKTYYRHRVLISTERVLDPQSEDALLCITGAQLEMLRNLTQYLKRRSTFSQSETEAGYLAPDSDDWDDIQAIVADLEEKLMGCEELFQLFEDMLTQLQCICDKESLPSADLGSIDNIIEIGIEDGDLIENDPYGVNTEVEARRCAVAQLTYWQAWGWLTEVIQPGQENVSDVVFTIFLLVIKGMVGAGPLAIPAGFLLALVAILVAVWVDGSLEDVKNSVWANREELTCAVYQGLSYDYTMAETRAGQVIDDIGGLSPIDIQVLKKMFSPWAMKLASQAYTAGTDWAVAQVNAGDCDDCDWVYEVIYTFPPCPGDWDGGFPCWTGRWPGLNANEAGTTDDFELPSILANVDIEIETRFMSRFNSGFTVGYTPVQYQDVGLDWHNLGNNTCTTTKLAGAINTQTYTTEDVTVPRNVLRVDMEGQPGQTETDPWPFMPTYIRIKIFPHV